MTFIAEILDFVGDIFVGLLRTTMGILKKISMITTSISKKNKDNKAND